MIEPDRLMTVRLGAMGAIEEVRKRLQTGEGPGTSFDLLALVAVNITEQLE